MNKIYIANRKRKEEAIQKQYPGAVILDITSKAHSRSARMLSPFYPHGGIPIPYSHGRYSFSVEGVWQGLKVFSSVGVDEGCFSNATGKDLKRTVRKYGTPLGHQKGLDSQELLSYDKARAFIYLPSYFWMLENIPEVQHTLDRIKVQLEKTDVVLLDYNLGDYEDFSKPLSHAGLVRLYLLGEYPRYEEIGGGDFCRVFPRERTVFEESKPTRKRRREKGDEVFEEPPVLQELSFS